VEYNPVVKTIQVVMDERLLEALDHAAQQEEVNRSALIRSSVKEMLRRRRIAELERLDREAYVRIPDDPEEHRFWLEQAVWPDD
jgi:metal-responsive CopG/Arc/MetJ family transcriptional regulator